MSTGFLGSVNEQIILQYYFTLSVLEKISFSLFSSFANIAPIYARVREVFLGKNYLIEKAPRSCSRETKIKTFQRGCSVAVHMVTIYLLIKIKTSFN